MHWGPTTEPLPSPYRGNTALSISTGVAKERIPLNLRHRVRVLLVRHRRPSRVLCCRLCGRARRATPRALVGERGAIVAGTSHGDVPAPRPGLCAVVRDP